MYRPASISSWTLWLLAVLVLGGSTFSPARAEELGGEEGAEDLKKKVKEKLEIKKYCPWDRKQTVHKEAK